MTTNKTNSNALYIWIAENGDTKARQLIKQECKLCSATLSRILGGHVPRFETRYRIYKLTGVKLSGEDDFPDLSKVQAS